MWPKRLVIRWCNIVLKFLIKAKIIQTGNIQSVLSSNNFFSWIGHFFISISNPIVTTNTDNWSPWSQVSCVFLFLMCCILTYRWYIYIDIENARQRILFNPRHWIYFCAFRTLDPGWITKAYNILCFSLDNFTQFFILCNLQKNGNDGNLTRL